jgi:hypothetical protein
MCRETALFRISRQKRVRTCAVWCLYSVGSLLVSIHRTGVWNIDISRLVCPLSYDFQHKKIQENVLWPLSNQFRQVMCLKERKFILAMCHKLCPLHITSGAGVQNVCQEV